MRWLLALVAIAGCGRFGFDPAGGTGGDDAPGGDGGPGRDGPGGDGGPGDDASMMIDAPAGACIAPGNGCTFPGGLPCSCFGTPMMVNAGLSESSGNLKITPNANTIGAQGSCVRNATPFGAGGAIVEISAVVSSADGLTAIQLGGGGDVYTFSILGGQLIAEDAAGMIGMTAYNATAMRWLRMRPSGPGVVFEYAADGVAFTPLVTSGKPPSPSYPVRIIAGTLAAVAAPGFAQIESVNLCGP